MVKTLNFLNMIGGKLSERRNPHYIIWLSLKIRHPGIRPMPMDSTICTHDIFFVMATLNPWRKEHSQTVQVPRSPSGPLLPSSTVRSGRRMPSPLDPPKATWDHRRSLDSKLWHSIWVICYIAMENGPSLYIWFNYIYPLWNWQTENLVSLANTSELLNYQAVMLTGWCQ